MSKTKAEQHAAVEVVAEPHFEGNGRGYGVGIPGGIYVTGGGDGAVTDCGGVQGYRRSTVPMDDLAAQLKQLEREVARAKMLRRTRQELRDALVSARALGLLMADEEQRNPVAIAQLGRELGAALEAFHTLEADAP